jgi:hypothetical protein
MYRVSVTTIEKFRRYMTEASSLDTEDALIQSIKGIFEGNDKTKVGTAFHKIIEGDVQRLPGKNFLADGISFTYAQARPAIEYRKRHPKLFQEQNIRQVFETARFPIQVTGRVDALEGLYIRDSKTKFRNIDIREYIDSCQWKFYLNMMGAHTFFFDVFEVKGFDKLHNCQDRLELGESVSIIAHDPIECIAYPEMEDEIVSLLHDFLDYIDNRNLSQFLKPALPDASIFEG